MHNRLPGLIGALLCALAMVACNQELGLIEANQCGNKIFEPLAGEDCDGEANCRPPAGHGECRFACNPKAECPDGCDPEPGCAGPAPCCPGGLECCPSGFACGVDSVCRRASGEFVVTDASSTPTLGLSLGDLEGDGRVDVVRLSRDTTSVHFYDDDLTPALVTTIQGGPSLPVVGNLTADGGADLALRVFMGTELAGGVAVFRTQPDRTLAPTIYSGITLLGIENARFATVDALSPAIPRELVLFAKDEALAIVPGVAKSAVALGLLDASGLVGIAVGNFDEDSAASPCEEVAYAYGAETQIELLESCEPDGDGGFGFADPQQQLLPPVRLPPGFEVLGLPPPGADPSVDPRQMQRLFAVHWNGGDTPPDDRHLDLLIVTRESGSSSPPRLHVAFGVGDGTFHSTDSVPPADGDGWAAPLVLPYEHDDGAEGEAFGTGGGSSGVPLVFADFNGDETIDVASSVLLLVSDPGGSAPYRCLMSDTDWGAAVGRDFNGNGTLDLVAARQARSGLEFLDGAGDGTFSLSVLPSERAISHLASGDFDGDLLADVVFAHPAAAETGGGADSAEEDAVYVSFGRSAGSPELPVKLGELKNIEQIVPGAIRATDSADEVLILARREPGSDDPLRAGIVIGSGDRQLHAPFIFQTFFGGPSNTSPVWVAHGRFSSEEKARGVGVMTLDIPVPTEDDPEPVASYRVWLASSSGDDAELTAMVTGASANEQSGLNCEGCVVAAVDLGGDQIDELVTFGPDPNPEGEGGLLSVYAVVDDGGPQGFERTAEHSTSLSFPDVRLESREGATEVRPVVRDIDRDGRKDVAMTVGSVVVVFWNDGTAEMAQQWASEQASVTPIEIPSGEELTDIALLNADEDRELELVVLTTSGVRLLQLIGTRQWQSFEDGEQLWDSAAKTMLSGGNVIAAGDLDGDGVEDLVIGDFGSYRALKGRTVRP